MKGNKVQISIHVVLLTLACSSLLFYLLYFEVSRDVGPGQDANGGREKNGKHLEKAAISTSPVRRQVLYEDIACMNQSKNSGFRKQICRGLNSSAWLA